MLVVKTGIEVLRQKSKANTPRPQVIGTELFLEPTYGRPGLASAVVGSRQPLATALLRQIILGAGLVAHGVRTPQPNSG